MTLDTKKLRDDVRGFQGRFFYDEERGDIGYIAKDCDDKQCDCEPSYNADGDIDCSVSILDDTGNVSDIGAPVARMLNAVGPLLDEIERLEAQHVRDVMMVAAVKASRDKQRLQTDDDAETWWRMLAPRYVDEKLALQTEVDAYRLQSESLREQLAAMTKARNEACDIARSLLSDISAASCVEVIARLDELSKVGAR